MIFAYAAQRAGIVLGQLIERSPLRLFVVDVPTNFTNVFSHNRPPKKCYLHCTVSGAFCLYPTPKFFRKDPKTIDKYREINDTQRAYERAIREKKALAIGLKDIDPKGAKAYALDARKTFDEYARYCEKNKVARYPDRCKVFDGEELITPKYKRILDLYKK